MYGASPPPALTLALPVLLHAIELLIKVVLAVTGVGCVVMNEAVVVHPLLSVTLTVYVPADNPVAVILVCPLGFHKYVYGAVPPLAAAVAVPVLPPLHATPVLVAVTLTGAGWVIVKLIDAIHPLESRTVTVYVPAESVETLAVVYPPGVHR